MAEHYFFLKTILLYAGIGLSLMFILAMGVCEIAERVRVYRHRRKLHKILKDGNEITHQKLKF